MGAHRAQRHAIAVYLEMYQTPAENIIKAPVADVLPVVEALEEAPAEFAPTLVVEEPAEPPAMVVDEESGLAGESSARPK